MLFRGVLAFTLMTDPQVYIKENNIFELSPELLATLLKDHTLSSEDEQVNIFWATDSYAGRGEGYQYDDKITVESITGANGDIRAHNGTYAIIKDWGAPKAKQKIRFIDLI